MKLEKYKFGKTKVNPGYLIIS